MSSKMHKLVSRQKWFAILVLTAGLIMALVLNFLLSGCAYGPSKAIKDKIKAAGATKQQYYNSDGMPVEVPTLPKQTITERLLTSSDAQVITKTVKSTDWLMTLFIVVSVLGIIAGLHGLKSGWLVVAGCVAGAGMKAAFSIASTYILSGLIFVGVIAVVMVVVTIRSMKAKVNLGAKFQDAFKDVVGKVQDTKDELKSKIGLSGLGAKTMELEARSALIAIKTHLNQQKPETQQLVTKIKKEIQSDKIIALIGPGKHPGVADMIPVGIDPKATIIDAVMGNVPGVTTIEAANGDVVVTPSIL